MFLDIKICGLKTPEAVAAALDAGASHVGFIFFGKSPRNVAPAEAAALRAAASGRAQAVAVTVDADDALLDEISTAMQPDAFQLHGRESPQRVAEVKARYRRPVIKAFSGGAPADRAAIGAYGGVAARSLFDATPPRDAVLPGGNGVAFDWSVLSGLPRGVDYFLSGGLNAANVGEALRIANPPAIDVSSGVESAPGVKDLRLIETFFRAVAAARG